MLSDWLKTSRTQLCQNQQVETLVHVFPRFPSATWCVCCESDDWSTGLRRSFCDWPVISSVGFSFTILGYYSNSGISWNYFKVASVISNSSIFSPGVYGDIFRNQDSNAWYEGGAKLIEDNLKVKKNTNTAKSGILFVGDGLGITTITAARIYDGQLKSDVQFGEENVLSWETFPWTALSKTYHVDLQGTDSASAATALLCGIKTNSGMLSNNYFLKTTFCFTTKYDDQTP